MKFDEILSSPSLMQQHGRILFKITEDLVREKTIEHSGQMGRFVDVVKDVINLVPVRFISKYLVRVNVVCTRILKCLLFVS